MKTEKQTRKTPYSESFVLIMPIHIMNIIRDNRNSLHSISDVAAIVHPILAQKSGYCIVMQNQKHRGNLIPIHSTHFNRIKFKDAPISVSAYQISALIGNYWYR